MPISNGIEKKTKFVESVPPGRFKLPAVDTPASVLTLTDWNALSEASKVSLKLQGGVMDDREAKKFISFKFHDKAILLRKYDDEGKIPNTKIKKIEEYRDLINSQLI